VAARLAYDPKITTVAIIDGGERHLFNQPLLSGLPTCQVRISAISPFGLPPLRPRQAHGGISAILQFDFSHRDSAFMMGNHRAHKIGVGITREGYVHIAMHLGICGPVGVAGGSFSEPDTAPVDPCWVCCAFAESGVKTAVIASISANGLLLPIITILLQ
jgi:hypothetical protein